MNRFASDHRQCTRCQKWKPVKDFHDDAALPESRHVCVDCFSDWLFERHCSEVAEAAKIFDARQAAGMSIFDAAENLPVPRANRAGLPAAAIRKLYEGSK